MSVSLEQVKQVLDILALGGCLQRRVIGPVRASDDDDVDGDHDPHAFALVCFALPRMQKRGRQDFTLDEMLAECRRLEADATLTEAIAAAARQIAEDDARDIAEEDTP